MSEQNTFTLLVSGGIGFIGSWYCDEVLRNNPTYKIICVDKLTYCTSPRTSEMLSSKYGPSRFELIVGDICDMELINRLKERLHDTYYQIVHLAAESLVETSFEDPEKVAHTNIMGTMNLLEIARLSSSFEKSKKPLFLYMSTDEVYGEQINCHETKTPLQPTTPYAATKASADHLVQSYATTWKLPVQIIRCSNVFGPRQYPEKIVPIVCKNLIHDPPLPSIVHGTGENSRRYTYVTDAIKAIELVRKHGDIGGIYNVGTDETHELSNTSLVKLLIKIAGHEGEPLLQYGPDRLYNDARYSMDCNKISKLGWQPAVGLEEGLEVCLEWERENPDWFSS